MKAWPYPRLIAHRAGGILAPENTLAAIRLGRSLGYRTVEIDVRFSRDGVAVLQHDAKLERNTNGQGPFAERTWEELSRLDAGSWRGEAYRGEPLVRLADAAALLRAERMFAHVEVKRVPGLHRQCGEQAAREVARLWAGAPERPLVISFSADALDAARIAAPEVDRGWIVQAPWDGDLAPLEGLDAVSLHLEDELISADLIREVHARGRRILAWTVNDVGRARQLLDWGLDGVVTDNIGEMAAAFPKML